MERLRSALPMRAPPLIRLRILVLEALIITSVSTSVSAAMLQAHSTSLIA
jgi:hypothetical protein